MESPQTSLNPAQVGLLRELPSVDQLLARPRLRELEAQIGHALVLDAGRRVLQNLRDRIAQGNLGKLPAADEIDQQIIFAAKKIIAPSLVPVINATGVILHTNMGRAPLAPEALEHVARVAGGYSNLEYNLERGERGERDIHTDHLFNRLVGCERSLVVNNNAAAVFLALNTLAEDAEVIVSRGELIEIGGSFRIPDVCAKSGAILREVGTTNRTRVADYAAAITERTRVLLRVHPSNFRIVGFTERPGLDELVELARRHNLVLMEDLGSGAIMDLSTFGAEAELPVGQSLKAGVDVVAFSGDKLLGGPQAGVLAGKAQLLQRIRKNPLFRVLRVDKLTIAALEATASIYLQGRWDSIPTLRVMRLSKEQITRRADHLAARISALPGFSASVRDGESVIGGGSTPGQTLPTSLVAIRHAQHSAARLDAKLRLATPAIIGRLEQDEFLLDLRTVMDGQDEEIARAIESVASNV
jgi:L-seryl-tRNA(Ser) seleniumtransferase